MCATWDIAVPQGHSATVLLGGALGIRGRLVGIAGWRGMVATRWRRYGKDRLYVTDDESGADVGWWDLLTDEAHPATAELHPVLAEAVGRWRAEQAGAPEVQAPAADPSGVVTGEWDRPGAPTPDDSPVVSVPSELPVADDAPAPSPVAPLGVVDGVAGGSAAHEFRRRHDARQERAQANHPVIGKFLLAVFDDPQSTRALVERRGGVIPCRCSSLGMRTCPSTFHPAPSGVEAGS